MIVIAENPITSGLKKYDIESNSIFPVADLPEEFNSMNGEQDEEVFENIFGLSKKERDARLERKKLKAQGKKAKGLAKLEEAKAKSVMAKGTLDKSADIALANALATPASADAEPKGMSTGMKIGIGVGILAVVGGIIFFVMKKKKK